MTRLDRLLCVLLLTLTVALTLSVVMMVRQARRLAVLQRQQAAAQQSLREAQEALRQRELQKPPAEPETPAPPEADRAALAKRNATIEQLRRELGEARAQVKELQTQLSNANDEREKALASADEFHQKEKADWQSQLDAAKQDLEAAQAGLQASRQRVAALEADNAKLKADNSAGAAHNADVAQVLAELQDLDNRREAYMTSIMRRYRDITSQFRAMSGMLGSTRDSTSTSPFSDSALTRVQSAVSAADDDLRQLTQLNDQARQLEKKLAKK